MDNNGNGRKKQEALVKFHAPKTLKSDLRAEARSRNISLAAFMRLIASEYIRNKT